MDKHFAVKHSLRMTETNNEVTLAETSVRMPIHGQCLAKFTVKENVYSDVTFNVLNNLATDVIIGQTIFKKHDKVVFSFDGDRPSLTLNSLPKMTVPYPQPFNHLSSDCRPIADKPRKYSKDDQEFIKEETRRL